MEIDFRAFDGFFDSHISTGIVNLFLPLEYFLILVSDTVRLSKRGPLIECSRSEKPVCILWRIWLESDKQGFILKSAVMGDESKEWMIEVKGLTKRYGDFEAISNLNFTVKRGEILGLLGPNGAGKSTTLRILSTFLAATSGTARVAGFDVFDESHEVRKRIGYMPENNPLYYDMRVYEYLKYRGRLKGLDARQSRDRAETVMKECDLEDVRRKMIRQLSLGYRQRVGLADALLSEPELIILDEPTLGLDPNQVRAARQLIKNLGGKHTVLISSHILHEIEMTCNRVLILNQGKILASDDTTHLQSVMGQSSRVVAEIKAPLEDLKFSLKNFEGLLAVDISAAEGEYYLCSLSFGAETADPREELYKMVVRNNWLLRELTISRPSLEDVFVHLTRKQQDEEEDEE